MENEFLEIDKDKVAIFVIIATFRMLSPTSTTSSPLPLVVIVFISVVVIVFIAVVVISSI